MVPVKRCVPTRCNRASDTIDVSGSSRNRSRPKCDVNLNFLSLLRVWHHLRTGRFIFQILTCLSFCSCFVIASLLLFWLFESSVLFESACFELAEPKHPIVAHQHDDDWPPSGVSGDSVVPRASPLRASINVNYYVCVFTVVRS